MDTSVLVTTPRIWVYTKPACIQANATYKALDKQELAYELVDMSTDDDARDYVMALGYLQAPVVIVEWPTPHDAPHLREPDRKDTLDHWSGFRPDRIKSITSNRV